MRTRERKALERELHYLQDLHRTTTNILRRKSLPPGATPATLKLARQRLVREIRKRRRALGVKAGV